MMEHPEETWENLIYKSFKPKEKEKIVLPNLNNLTSKQKDILVERKRKHLVLEDLLSYTSIY